VYPLKPYAPLSFTAFVRSFGRFRHGEPPAPAAAAAMERRHADDWVNAPEFVPSWASAPEPEPEAEPAVALASQLQPPAAMSYARAVDPAAGRRLRAAQATAMLCPHYWMGRCEVCLIHRSSSRCRLKKNTQVKSSRKSLAQT